MIGIMPYGNDKVFCLSFEPILKRAGIDDFMFSPACCGDTEINYERACHYIRSAPLSRHIVLHSVEKIRLAAAHFDEITGRTIVITGFRIPEGEPDSDADFNLGMAIGAIRHLLEGVYIALDGAVVPWREYNPS